MNAILKNRSLGGYYYSDEELIWPQHTWTSISCLLLCKQRRRNRKTPRKSFIREGFEIFHTFIHACIHTEHSWLSIVLQEKRNENFPKRKTLLEHVNFKTTFHVHFSYEFFFSENYFSKIEEMVKCVFYHLVDWVSSHREMLSFNS